MSVAGRALLAGALALLAAVFACAPEPASAPEPTALENGSFDLQHQSRTIHYQVRGQGPVLMTLPNSWGLSLEALRALYRRLEGRLTLVYFDPRGMGGSSPVREESDMGLAAVRADFQTLRRHLGLDRVHAIGWSNGAMNLILLAAERPETLSSAVFVHGLASFTEDDQARLASRYPELMQQFAAFQQEMAGESMPAAEKTARIRELWLNAFFPAMLADPEASRSVLDEVFAEAELSWAHSEYANREVSVFDFRDRLPGISVRSLVIAGAHDLEPPAAVEELHRGLPDSVFAVFEHSGHFAPVEEPEEFTRTVWDFLGVAAPAAR